jgi:hypothetical protein
VSADMNVGAFSDCSSRRFSLLNTDVDVDTFSDCSLRLLRAHLNGALLFFVFSPDG